MHPPETWQVTRLIQAHAHPLISVYKHNAFWCIFGFDHAVDFTMQSTLSGSICDVGNPVRGRVSTHSSLPVTPFGSTRRSSTQLRGKDVHLAPGHKVQTGYDAPDNVQSDNCIVTCADSKGLPQAEGDSSERSSGTSPNSSTKKAETRAKARRQ